MLIQLNWFVEKTNPATLLSPLKPDAHYFPKDIPMAVFNASNNLQTIAIQNGVNVIGTVDVVVG